MMSRWHPRLEAARFRLLRGAAGHDGLARPFLAYAVHAMQPGGHRDGCPTCAISQRWVVYWNDRWIEAQSMAALAATVYHELLHVLRRHHSRLQHYPLDAANWAADLEINDDLEREGFELPPGVLTPRSEGVPPDLLAEEYVRMLPPQGSSSNGSGANGRPAPWEDAESQGLAPQEADLVRRAVAEEIRRSARMGDVPGHLQRWAEDLLGGPQVDWRRELAALIRRSVARVAGAVDYSYRRPRRTQPPGGRVILPAPDAPSPDVAVVIDTSGSVGDQQLQAVLAELRGILRATQRAVTVLACDSAVHRVGRVVRAMSAADLLVGGGGTDMGVGIAEAVARGADIVVVITDGYTPWPAEPPAVPCVVVLHGYGWAPDWARVVRVTV